MKQFLIFLANTTLLAILFASCQAKMVVQKAVYQQGKLVTVSKPVAFSLQENDTINIIKRVR